MQLANFHCPVCLSWTPTGLPIMWPTKVCNNCLNWAYTRIHKFDMRRIHTMISKLPVYVYRQLLYQGGTSLIPRLVGPPCHCFPISLVPISLVPHIIGPPINTHPPPIPLPPHWSPGLIDPPSHRSQGRIQDLKLGVAQMDGNIWKRGVGVGWVFKEHIYTHSTVSWWKVR